MVKLILSDNVAFLAFLLTVGSVILFAVVIKKMMMHESEEEAVIPEEQSQEEQPKRPAEDHETGLALIEAHLNAITQDISEIKQQVNSISSYVTAPDQDMELFKKQLAVMTTKLETISKVLSELAKE
jgi:septal ring factor EnvC (AmiA/AmiB activator)